MAFETAALDQALTRELAATGQRPLLYRLGDVFLPVGTEPPPETRLRCCACGFGCKSCDERSRCPLCGCRAWELQPERVRAQSGHAPAVIRSV